MNLLSNINYVYYGLYFLVLSFLQVVHVFLVPLEGDLRWVYAGYAVIQSWIEAMVLALVSSWLLHRGWKKWHHVYTLLTLLLLVLHGVDLILVRLMDISVWYGMSFIFQESWSNFHELLKASSISLSVWVLGLGCVVGVLLLGQVFYLCSQKMIRRKIRCEAGAFFGILTLSITCLLGADLFLLFRNSPKEAAGYAKALPWKRTMVVPSGDLLTVKGYLPPMQEKTPWKEADSGLFALERKPDIFLFIVESLREDFMTEEVTPYLSRFKKEHYAFDNALSSSNATHLSWFSTFYSTYPFYWKPHHQCEWKEGGYALNLLKKMGYEIHVYASSRLTFYAMDRIVLGQDRQLATSVKEFQLDGATPPYQADKMAITQLCQDLEDSPQRGGRLFLVFLDSTHFDYSWPKEDKTLFTPVEDINYVKLVYAKEGIPLVENRYRNALCYVDELFHEFELRMKQSHLWEDSLVVFTADHGEEFAEYGQMFHASTLSPPQLQIPLYMKLGRKMPIGPLRTEKMASQMDIFPTIFHYLIGEDSVADFLHGESLFVPDAKSYAIGARYNACRSPCQFYLRSGQFKMVLEFEKGTDIFHCNRLKIQSIEDENWDEVPYTPTFVQTYFEKPLSDLFGPK